MKYICGIDPGFTGGIAIVDMEGNIHELEPMPIKTDDVDKKFVDVLIVKELLEEFKPEHIYIEKVWGMPGQGGGRSFTFGEGYGAIKAVVEILKIPHTLVASTTWQSKLGLFERKEKLKKKEKKQRSVDRVNELYPREKQLTVKEDGLADALLIARYGLKEG
jgi:Holliday junction resolvasome RuvABC endonuclease subunit